MRLLIYLTTILVMSWLVQPSFAVATCDADSERAFRLGQKADEEDRIEDALKFYSNAAEHCSRFEYWMAVGDILVEDFFGAMSGEDVRAGGSQAVDAYANAFQVAESDEQKVDAAIGIANLGVISGDPLNARKWLSYASQLSPGHGDLDDLRIALEEQEESLSTDDIRRARGTVASLLFDTVALIEVEQPGGLPDLPSDAGVTVAMIPIPINFETNSTVPDPATGSNVRNLAQVLTEESEDAVFIFVGHADARGGQDYNMQLSERRAEAIQQSVELLHPQLRGRIVSEGSGEGNPTDFGNSPSALRANRRLEVWIQQP